LKTGYEFAISCFHKFFQSLTSGYAGR